MAEPKLCESCRAFMLDLLYKRILKILELGRYDDVETDTNLGHCFHLMEIERIVKGETTCGVYDDYGPPQPQTPARNSVAPDPNSVMPCDEGETTPRGSQKA